MGGGEFRDYSIDKMRFVLAIFIVYIHTFGQVPSPVQDNIVYSNGFFDTLRILISQGIARIGVPLFALFSGYFFESKEYSIGAYKKKICKRIVTLVIPYILWNIIAFLCLYSFSIITKKTSSLPEFIFHWGGIANIFIGWRHTPIDGPLWFVRDLFVVSLLSPVIHLLLKYLNVTFVLLLCVVYVTGFLNPFFSMTVFTFFSIGSFLKYNGKQLMELKCNLTICFIVCVSLLFMCVISYNKCDKLYDIAVKLFQFAGSLCFILLFKRLKNKESFYGIENNDLGPFSFFLYASHYFATLPLVSLFLDKVCPHIAIYNFICFIVTPIIVTYATFMLYKMLKLITPKLLNALNGARR